MRGNIRTPYPFEKWQAGAKPPRGWDCADAVEDGWGKPEFEDFFKAAVRPWTPPPSKDEVTTQEPPHELSPPAWLTEVPHPDLDAYGAHGAYEHPLAPAGPHDASDATTLTGEEPREPFRRQEAGIDPDMPALVLDLAASSLAPPVAKHEWLRDLVTNADGKTLPGITKNWTLFLENHPETASVFAYDEFAAEVMLVSRPPWDLGERAWKPRPVQDFDIIEAVEWLETRHLTPKVSTLDPVIEKIARRRPYHPVKNYFESLPVWDRKQRLDTFLTYYMGADDTALNRAIGRKWLCAIAWRVFVPGCKFDTALVLQGSQGMKKSSFGRALVPVDVWVTESVNVGDKAREVIENTSGILIAELAELAGKSTKEIEAVKKFMTVTHDKARGAYRRRADTVPRQFVFYASTNEEMFLTDTTGNRRWWPVSPRRIDLDAIKADRDQLWAEVMQSWRAEKIWIDEDSDLGRDLAELNNSKTDFGDYFDHLYDMIPDGDMLLSPNVVRMAITGGYDDVSRLPSGWRSKLHRALVGLGFDPVARQVKIEGENGRYYQRGTARRIARYSDGRIFLKDLDAHRQDDIF